MVKQWRKQKASKNYEQTQLTWNYMFDDTTCTFEMGSIFVPVDSMHSVVGIV